ncbi:hypothetical protein [Nocardia lijiangensis]|uniref:hypothetical protein n=1 Tax=Nocardia lijiangensis TaxID=299618 RepID=UPI000AE449BD|nr:hypothetical protein [Nocardia lijiangensis]
MITVLTCRGTGEPLGAPTNMLSYLRADSTARITGSARIRPASVGPVAASGPQLAIVVAGSGFDGRLRPRGAHNAAYRADGYCDRLAEVVNAHDDVHFNNSQLMGGRYVL